MQLDLDLSKYSADLDLNVLLLVHRNLDFDPDNEEVADLSDVSRSSGNESSDNESWDDEINNEMESDRRDVETQELSSAPVSIKNDEPDRFIKETHHSSATTSQEPRPSLDDAGNANSNPDFADDMQAVESEAGIGARRSSGRVRKWTEIDSRCECDTLITAEEQGCETGWVCGTVSIFIQHIFRLTFGNNFAFSSTSIAWILNLYQEIGCVPAENP